MTSCDHEEERLTIWKQKALAPSFIPPPPSPAEFLYFTWCYWDLKIRIQIKLLNKEQKNSGLSSPSSHVISNYKSK